MCYDNLFYVIESFSLILYQSLNIQYKIYKILYFYKFINVSRHLQWMRLDSMKFTLNVENF